MNAQWESGNMLDFKFDWSKDVETGIPIMDTQHKEFFRIGRNVEQLVMCRCIGVTNKQLLDIVMELREYVAYHFYEEELLMKDYNYPDYMEHKKKHDATIQYILHVDLRKLSLEPYAVLSEVRTFLQEWTFQHTLIDDIRLGHFLKEHGYQEKQK